MMQKLSLKPLKLLLLKLMLTLNAKEMTAQLEKKKPDPLLFQSSSFLLLLVVSPVLSTATKTVKHALLRKKRPQKVDSRKASSEHFEIKNSAKGSDVFRCCILYTLFNPTLKFKKTRLN